MSRRRHSSTSRRRRTSSTADVLGRVTKVIRQDALVLDREGNAMELEPRHRASACRARLGALG
jgi:hypothetical protein